jgi:hypothetical protein
MYTLRVPFTVPLNREIMGLPISGNLDDLIFVLDKEDRFYVITVEGFTTENAAKEYLNNIWAGLMWLLLHRGLSPDAVFETSKVVYAEDPYEAAKNYGFKNPIDAFIDGGCPAVYPTNKRICKETANPITPYQTYHARDVFNLFRDGLAFEGSATVILDRKLRVALELWGAYFTEISSNARFLSLIMALEAMATGIPRTQLVLDLLEKWKKEVEALRNTVEAESDDDLSLEALGREVLVRKEDSIRRQIRRLVFTTLQSNGDKDAAVMAKKALDVYDQRSTLVHKGQLEPPELGTATNDAKNIVERVLKSRFLQNAKP